MMLGTSREGLPLEVTGLGVVCLASRALALSAWRCLLAPPIHSFPHEEWNPGPWPCASEACAAGAEAARPPVRPASSPPASDLKTDPRPCGLSPEGLPLALLKATRIAADMPRLAAARHKEGGEELGKGPEDIHGRDCAGQRSASARIALRLSPKSLLAVPRGGESGVGCGSSADPTGDLSRGGPQGGRRCHSW